MAGAVDLKVSDRFERWLSNEPGHSAVMRLGGVHEEWMTEVHITR